ncbi:hypothetical protein N0V90_005375 [Kalmusia sp. IMI 367209]|nr:hypothetical protein N0V90_005375 [Kalmusia sp. IMI 367209]
MVRTKQAARTARGDATRPSNSRIAKTPHERLRAAKDSLQTSYHNQSKLHEMFEQMIAETETLQRDYDRLQDGNRRLNKENDELIQAKEDAKKEREGMESHISDLEIRASNHMYELNIFSIKESNLKEQISTLHHKNTEQAQEVENLKRQLAEEKDKARINKETQERLDKIRKQWADMTVLMDGHRCAEVNEKGAMKEEPVELDD